MMGKSCITTCAGNCLEQLKKFLLNYTGTEQPTFETLRTAQANGEDLPKDPNVFFVVLWQVRTGHR